MPVPLSHNASLVFTNLGTLTRTAALPQENTPTRLPTASSTERTAVTAFQDTNTIAFDIYAEGGLAALLFRDVTCPLFVQATVGNTSLQYTSQNLQNVQLPGTADTPLTSDLQLDTPTLYQAGTCSLTSYPGSASPMANDPALGANYFWFPGGGALLTATIQSAYTFSAGVVQVRFARWLSPGNETSMPEFSFTIPLSGMVSTGSSVYVYNSGWYRPISWNTLGAPNTTYLVQATFGWTTAGAPNAPTGTISGLLPFALPSEWATSYLPFQNTRCTAAAALFTNITQVLAKQGTALAARLEPGDDYFNFAKNNATIATRIPNEKYFGALENGIYSFTSPALESLSFLNHTLNGSAAASVVPLIHLANLGPANAFLLQDAGISPYGQLAVTVDWHLEFRTNSCLFQTATCITPLEVQHQAEIALGTVPNFYENHTHKSEIISGVSKAAKMVSKIAGPGPIGLGLRAGATVLDKINRKVQPPARMQQVGMAPAARPSRPPAKTPRQPRQGKAKPRPNAGQTKNKKKK